MFGINLQQVLSFVRWALATATGWAVGKGYLTADVGAAIATVVLGLVPLVWGFLTHTDTAAANTAGAVVDKQVTKADALTAAGPTLDALSKAGVTVSVGAKP